MSSLLPDNSSIRRHRDLSSIGLETTVPQLRRNATGGIDYDYYLSRAHAARNMAIRSAARRIAARLTQAFVPFRRIRRA